MSVAVIVAALVGGLAFVCWISAFVHWIMLLGHRRPEVSAMTLFFNGYKAFDRECFLPSGHGIQRRMLYSMLAFAACILLGVGVGALATAR
jgi:hypothetical protein